jgi:hypothetical protein
MTSNRPQHNQASSTDPPGGDTRKPCAQGNLSVDQSASAAVEKPTLSALSDQLMEQVVDERNMLQAFRVSPKNVVKFKDRVREITRRTRGISMKTRLRELGDYLRGWTGYFAIVPIKSFFVELDKWVRRRVRSCYWKQWRKPRTRIRNLLALGLP